MQNFAAIDFETANSDRSSICSVGVVVVRNGKIANQIYRLVRPTPAYYSPFCTEVHGLTERDTANSPAFPDVWAEIAPVVAGLPLVAHNKAFDENCLRAVHEVYGMPYPGYTFYCTLQTSRKIFGSELPDHRLPTVARKCGYDLTKHHNAISDALACAHIAMRILEG